MADYINRKSFRDKLLVSSEYLDEDTLMTVINILDCEPAESVAPVRSGEWILGDVEPGYFTPGGNRPWICSKCEQVVSWSLGRPEYNYCHNCGAKMDGGENNDKQ